MTRAQLSLFAGEFEDDRRRGGRGAAAPPVRKLVSRRAQRSDAVEDEGSDLFAAAAEPKPSPEIVFADIEMNREVPSEAETCEAPVFERPMRIPFEAGTWLLRPDEGDFINIRTGEIRDEDEFTFAPVANDVAAVSVEEWDESQDSRIEAGVEDLTISSEEY